MIKFYLFPISGLFISASLFAQSNTFPDNGNVGIGTMGPLNGLHVFSNNDFGKGSVRIGYSGAEDAVLSFGWNGTDQDAFKITKFPHNASANGTNLFTISSNNGNVGIGTARPFFKLDVQGGNFSVYNTGNPSIASIGSGSNNKTLIQLSTSADENGYGILQSVAASNVAWGNTIINPNGGNVGIGTTSPDARLVVNGTVHAKEVRVDLNVPGADYVFDKSYPLKPLSKVYKYIALNHHLPDVPSAKSMEQNGIDVSIMNMKLLQKVEELTLYIIQLKKENARLSKRLRKLENRK